jgi:hypothetical protein
MATGSSKPRKRRKDAGKPKILSEAHKRKMQTARERKKQEREKTEAKQEQTQLRATVKRLHEHVAKMERENEKAYVKYQRTSSDKNLNTWMQANSKLLNAVTAMRAHEERLHREG